MKRLPAMLLCLLLLVTTVSADVIVSPVDAFWISHHDDLEILYRQYTTNSEQGYVSIWERPLSRHQRENVPNGELLTGRWHYTDTAGAVWFAASGETYEDIRGWVRAADCVPVPDHISFVETYGDQFTPYNSAYDQVLKGIETVVVWAFPGSGVVLFTESSDSWSLEHRSPLEIFENSWTDGAGRVWGSIPSLRGYRNVWVCLSDPANPDLPPDPEVLPDEPVWYPAAETIPAPTNGVPVLAIVLVAAVVVCTAALIPLACCKKKGSH